MPNFCKHKLLVRKVRRLLPRIHRVIGFQLFKSDSSQFRIRHFSTKDISRATFGHSLILGADSHGNIYKAQFSDGLIATVRKAAPAESRSRGSFYREVEFLGRLHHRNLVGLRGFSEGRSDNDDDDDGRFLVFDYMGNGSLKDWLHDPLKTPLDWRTRLHIAVSVAAALEYLLFFSSPPIVNKDISIASTNVFLDENFVAKICHVGGSLGYGSSNLRHEPQTAPPSSSRDCYGDVMFQYGVLLLELITGQSFESEGEDLMKWIQDSRFSSWIQKMVDSDLGENYDFGEVRCLLNIARLCTRRGGDGPKIPIRQILRYLQNKLVEL